VLRADWSCDIDALMAATKPEIKGRVIDSSRPGVSGTRETSRRTGRMSIEEGQEAKTRLEERPRSVHTSGGTSTQELRARPSSRLYAGVRRPPLFLRWTYLTARLEK
jgi:hypothetical protein